MFYGLDITIQGVTFAPNSLPPVPTANPFLDAAGVSDVTVRAGYNKFFDDMTGTGVWALKDVILPFAGATAASQKWDMKGPTDRVIWNADSTDNHTAKGYKPSSTTKSYGDTKFNIPAVQDFNASVYNSTPDVATSMLIALAGTGTRFYISRNYESRTKAMISGTSFAANVPQAPTGYDRTKRGLLTVVKIGTSAYLYDDGVLIAVVTGINGTLAAEAVKSVLIGTFNGVDYYSAATIPYVSLGKYAMTAQQVMDEKTSVYALLGVQDRLIG